MGDLSTPNSVQKLQTALHAKAKAEPGYRFYALYDKISREDILAHAYAQCRSNKGAPGVDRQDFEAVETYGVERWLGELALALRQETYRPDPIRRVYIPKANGKLRPLGISTVRDRVCMTAAMLVLEPIFEADLPSELYAYRRGRNAQQAVVEVEELVFRGHREVVDADLADYFGSVPHADLLKSVARRIVDRRVLPTTSSPYVRRAHDPHRDHPSRVRRDCGDAPVRLRRLREPDQRAGRAPDLVGPRRGRPSEGHARTGRELQRRDLAAGGRSNEERMSKVPPNPEQPGRIFEVHMRQDGSRSTTNRHCRPMNDDGGSSSYAAASCAIWPSIGPVWKTR